MLLLRGLLVITCLDSVLSISSCLDKPCSCCKRGECEDPSLHLYPCDGCITGFTGPSCLQPCPKSCENCSQLFFEYDTEKVCFQCKDGFYNGQYRDIEIYPFQQDCSLACNTGCELCTSYNDCSKCKVGYLLSEGKECKECPPNCEQCLSEFSCLACQDGYAWSGVVCQPCKPSCKRCKYSGECIECYSGFYERDNDCVRCPLGCAKCSGPDICNDCQEGNYLVQGQCVECQDNCKACSLNSISQYTCRTCRNGFFLSNNICLECETGCISCKSKSDCLTCLSSYQLNDGKCFSCSARCTSCSMHNNCTACESNYYLMDGHCHSCRKNCAICSSDKLCITCEHGYFGTDCSHVCQSNCANNICNKSTGQCTACRDGYYFDQFSCIKCPNHCSVCTSNTACLSCASGYMGITCEEKCTQCSLGTACDKSTGYCFEACADGLSGKRCNLPCDSKCLSCNRANPSKCSKCALDRYGAACQSKCSEKCANKACDDIDSVCTNGCVAGFWGSRCERSCHENCKSSMCKRNSGACSAGCIANFKGDKCGCPVNCKCDDNDFCVRCLQGYGEKCDKKCGGGCADGTCDRISGECLNGCIHGFRGVSCSTSTERTVNVGLIMLGVSSLMLLASATLVFIFRNRIKIPNCQTILRFRERYRGSNRAFQEEERKSLTGVQPLTTKTDKYDRNALISWWQSHVGVCFRQNNRGMKAANACNENGETQTCLDNLNTDCSYVTIQFIQAETCLSLVTSDSVSHTEVESGNVKEERAQQNKQNDELQIEICEKEKVLQFNDIDTVRSLSAHNKKTFSQSKREDSAIPCKRIPSKCSLMISSENIQDKFISTESGVKISETQTPKKTTEKSKSLNNLSPKPNIEETAEQFNQNLRDQTHLKTQENKDSGRTGHVTCEQSNEYLEKEKRSFLTETNHSTPDVKPPEEIDNKLSSSESFLTETNHSTPDVKPPEEIDNKLSSSESAPTETNHSTPDIKPPEEIGNTLSSSESVPPETSPFTPDVKPPEEIDNNLSSFEPYSQDQPARNETAEGNQETPSDMRQSSRGQQSDNKIGENDNDTQLKQSERDQGFARKKNAGTTDEQSEDFPTD